MTKPAAASDSQTAKGRLESLNGASQDTRTNVPDIQCIWRQREREGCYRMTVKLSAEVHNLIYDDVCLFVCQSVLLFFFYRGLYSSQKNSVEQVNKHVLEIGGGTLCSGKSNWQSFQKTSTASAGLKAEEAMCVCVCAWVWVLTTDTCTDTVNNSQQPCFTIPPFSMPMPPSCIICPPRNSFQFCLTIQIQLGSSDQFAR